VIGKTTKGRGFGGVLRYVFEKPGAKYIGGNMMGSNPSELALEFRAIAKRNKRVKIPAAHISFSPSPQEHLDDLQALEFAQAYMDKIGFSDCQWVLAEHNDTKTPKGEERPHFHIIANRVRITDGKVVTAWCDWRRSELALRQLEEEFKLIKVQPSWENENSTLSTGQIQRVKKELHEFEEGKRDNPPELPIKVQLQNTIDQATHECPTMPQLIERLQNAGIEVKVGYTRTGKVKGISYKQGEIAFSGTQLGKAYTFPGLIKHKKVGYDSFRDDETIKVNIYKNVQFQSQVKYDQYSKESYTSVCDKNCTEVTQKPILPKEQERIQFIANFLADYLAEKKVQRLQGKNYTAYWDSDELALVENNNTNAPLEIMRVKYEDNQWQTVEIPQLNQAHEKDFQEMHLAIQRERTKIITPIVTSLLESQYAKKKNIESDSSILRLEGENYILV